MRVTFTLQYILPGLKKMQNDKKIKESLRDLFSFEMKF